MFVHLHCHSPHSYLDGASSVSELLERTRELGMGALAITDHDTVAGAVDLCRLAPDFGIRPIVGAEITMEDGGHLVLLAKDPPGYENLCRLLSRSHLKNPRLEPRLDHRSLALYRDGLIALSGCRKGAVPSLILRRRYRQALAKARELLAIFGAENLYLEIGAELAPGDRALHYYMRQLGQEAGLGVVATNNVHFASKERFFVHDLLTCVRARTLLSDADPRRRLNAENYLKSESEMLLATGGSRAEVELAAVIGERCQPPLSLGGRNYPTFNPPHGAGGGSFLRQLVYRGARERYGKVTDQVRQRLESELKVIMELDLASYFLLVWDVVRYARERGIRYAGRGSAADSAVAYCLYITEVDSLSRRLLFERFINSHRSEPPDIDIDFDARYRDDVAGYVRDKYGAEQVARVAAFNTFRAKSAIREMGRAMQFPEADLDRLAKTMPHVAATEAERAVAEMPEFRGLEYGDRYGQLFRAAAAVAGFPRHVAAHLGGMVITSRPLYRWTALQLAAIGEPVCQLDKRGVEFLGLLKLDLLSLRTMSAIEDAVVEIKTTDPDFDYDDIPCDDHETFSLIASGDTIGMFQLESPAQRSLQRRLGASSLEDVIASVALIRPGPIQGNMVEPYLERRAGREPVSYLHPSLEPVLSKTLGVVLFQEQVIEVATLVAGFTPGESDRLRRAMSHARSQVDMDELGRHFVRRAVENGLEPQLARTVLQQISSYASYGFCEGHAAAFGLTAYRTAYLLRHYPAEFLCGLMNHQPLGYYPLHTLGVEAGRRGIRILPLDINESGDRFHLKHGKIRPPLSLVADMPASVVDDILLQRRTEGRFRSLADLRWRVRVRSNTLENLIRAGAFDALNAHRRSLLWELAGGSPLYGDDRGPDDLSIGEKLEWEGRLLGLFTSGHPLQVLRPRLESAGFITSLAVKDMGRGAKVRVAGIPIRPHRPPTRSGNVVVFLSLQDEFGLIDVTVFPTVYAEHAPLLFGQLPDVLEVDGRLGMRDRDISIIASGLRPLSQGRLRV